METTLAVVVSAIVILITALVVITIFGGGVGQVGTLSNSQSICEAQARSSCSATGQMPLAWSTPSVNQPDAEGKNHLVSCSTASNGKNSCSSFGITTTPPATTPPATSIPGLPVEPA
jgi:3',5'-cyclic AMP phosphodiesterase CpdA